MQSYGIGKLLTKPCLLPRRGFPTGQIPHMRALILRLIGFSSNKIPMIKEYYLDILIIGTDGFVHFELRIANILT